VVAVQVLAALTGCTWPRMQVHAGIIVEHMQQLSKVKSIAAGGSNQHRCRHQAGVQGCEWGEGEGDSNRMLKAAVLELVQLLQVCTGERLRGAVSVSFDQQRIAPPGAVSVAIDQQGAVAVGAQAKQQ